jgi:hypothetical protein
VDSLRVVVEHNPPGEDGGHEPVTRYSVATDSVRNIETKLMAYDTSFEIDKATDVLLL